MDRGIYQISVGYQPTTLEVEAEFVPILVASLEPLDFEEDISKKAFAATIEVLRDGKDANKALEGNRKVEGVFVRRSMPHFEFNWAQSGLRFVESGTFILRIKAKKRGSNKALATAKTVVGKKYCATIESEPIVVHAPRTPLE
jgi:hypothetical protein